MSSCTFTARHHGYHVICEVILQKHTVLPAVTDNSCPQLNPCPDGIGVMSQQYNPVQGQGKSSPTATQCRWKPTSLVELGDVFTFSETAFIGFHGPAWPSSISDMCLACIPAQPHGKSLFRLRY
jgi:hypothetical protein